MFFPGIEAIYAVLMALHEEHTAIVDSEIRWRWISGGKWRGFLFENVGVGDWISSLTHTRSLAHVRALWSESRDLKVLSLGCGVMGDFRGQWTVHNVDV